MDVYALFKLIDLDYGRTDVMTVQCLYSDLLLTYILPDQLISQYIATLRHKVRQLKGMGPSITAKEKAQIIINGVSGT